MKGKKGTSGAIPLRRPRNSVLFSFYMDVSDVTDVRASYGRIIGGCLTAGLYCKERAEGLYR